MFTALGFAGYLALTEWKTVLNLSATISIPGTEKNLVLPNLYLFRAMPFLLLGMLMRMEETHINRWDEKKTVCFCTVGIVGGSALAVVEQFLIGDAMFYTGTYLALISCAVLAVRKPELGNRFWTTMGNRYSLFVYLYHTAVIDTINYIFNQKLHIYMSTNLLYAYTRPLIVVAFTLVAAWGVRALQDGWSRMSSPAPRKQSDAVR
ncbi:MAG: hypothetical protein LUG47_03715 [Clostridiales bacterium]|nr:hypothetical protein [Clostridiales bacterium]